MLGLAINHSFVNASEAVTDDLLASCNPQLICKWLCRFVMEARKSDGSFYPPSSLRSLVCGLNHVLQKNKAPFSVIDKNDHRFRDLIKTLDSLSSDLHRQGVGAVKHNAKVINPKHEDVFWWEGLLGYSSPKVLQLTVFLFFFMLVLILFLEVFKNSMILFLFSSHRCLKIDWYTTPQCITSMSSLCPKIINTDSRTST